MEAGTNSGGTTMTFEALMNWTILVAIVSSMTSYLFMRYGTIENIILSLTDFTEEDIRKIKGLIRWKF
ncbi:hypothetical protein FD31_GL002652 [Companilactobacillus nantensis DSM 16982]|uniref:Uncharacterized protein n=2 Tax=Companilactobacillus nantensis TaxID=305793 RepID=A0A0R1WQR5_9LACO|nr:hypothetical protein FD31_GL002652 [Companilactobacillus nantensis DSM 16982]